MDLELTVVTRYCMRGGQMTHHPFTLARARFEPALDLGLDVQRDGPRGRHNAHDHQRAYAVFRRLQELPLPYETELRADDRGVSLEHYGVVVAEPFLRGMLAVALQVAMRVESARAETPVRSEQGLEILSGLSLERGLRIMRVPLGLTGDLDGEQVSLFHSAENQDVARVRLAERFGGLLRLTPRPRGGGYAFPIGETGTRTGDASFDETFIMLSTDPARVVRSLSSDLRRELAAWAQHGGLELDSFALELKRPGGQSPAALVDLGHDAVALLRKLEVALELESAKKGPYR